MMDKKENAYLPSWQAKYIMKKIFSQWPELRKAYMIGDVGFSIRNAPGGAIVEPYRTKASTFEKFDISPFRETLKEYEAERKSA